MKNITTKIAKNGNIIVKIDGKRASYNEAKATIQSAMLNGNEIEFNTDRGDNYTISYSANKGYICNGNNNVYSCVWGDQVFYALSRGYDYNGTPLATLNEEIAEDDMAVEAEIEIVNNAAAEEIADKTVTFYPNATPKPCTGKLFGYDVCEYHSVKEYISELEFMQSAIIMERLFKNANGTYSYDGWGRKTYYMTDCYREAYYVACDTENVCLDAEDTANLIYIEQQLKNIVNGSDGSEEDINEDNVFDYLPALDELNDVDIDDDNTPPDNEPDDKQAKKEMAHKITAYLNDRNEKRLQAGFKPIIPYASSDAHYHKLHGAAKWTVAYDSVNDTFGIWSEYGWHESGFSLGHEFCGWYKIAGLAVIIIRLTNAIDYAQSEFYFETDPALLKRPRRSYGKWQAVRAAHLKDKIDRDAQASEEIAAE